MSQLTTKDQKLKHYSGEFKQSAVEEVIIDGCGLRETARKYEVTHKMVWYWIHVYMEKGAGALYKVQKSNDKIINTKPILPANKPSKSKIEKTKVSNAIPSEILDELNKLRMENAYLKKLNALAREKEKSKARIKLK